MLRSHSLAILLAVAFGTACAEGGAAGTAQADGAAEPATPATALQAGAGAEPVPGPAAVAVQTDGEVAAAPVPAAGATVAAPAAADPGVPPGHYQCWYWRSVYSPSGFSGELQVSAMGWIRLSGDGSYQTGLNPTLDLDDPGVETDTRGRYIYDASTNAFSFTSGWLQGAVASYERPDDAPPQVVFLEDENMVGDESRIDTNDTKCSFEHG